MDKPAFVALVRERTRQYQTALDQCDQMCAAGGREELRLQREIAQCLQRFAAVQLEQVDVLAPAISRELELRGAEEQALREELGTLRARLEQQRASLDAAKTASQTPQLAPADAGAEARDLLARALAAQAEHLALQTELSQEILRKLPAFSQDPVYAYLKKQGYGEPSYQGKGLDAMVDRWMAGFSRFAANRRNEQALLAMQTELALRTDQHQQAVQVARQAVPRPGTQDDVTARLAPIERAIQEDEERLRRIRTQLDAYAARSDARYLQASRMLAESLAGRPIEALAQLARNSATPDDDALVRQLDALQDELAKQRREQVQTGTARKQARAELACFAELLEALQTARWHTQNGEALCAGLDPAALLARYLDGGLSRDEVLAQAGKQSEQGAAA